MRLPDDPELWDEVLRALDEPAARRLLGDEVRAWIGGDRDPSQDAARAAALDRLADLAQHVVGEASDWAAGDRGVRRWCWIQSAPFREDEDLLLMSTASFAVLLDEAAAGCPKRDLVVDVVTHGVRDRAHDAVRRGTFDAHARTAAELVRHARAAREPELVAYLERIVRYSGRGGVDEAEARSRVHDLTRCAPPATVHLERRGNRWIGDLGSAALTIDAYNGEMAIEDR